MWNYRVINHGDHFALHEVIYDDDGTPVTYAEKAEIVGETLDEIGSYLKMMTEDYNKGRKKILMEKDFDFERMKNWADK